MAHSVTPFLMFDGVAEAAIDLYVSVFRGSKIERIERFGPGEPGSEGRVKRADISVAGQKVICFDSPIKHHFSFTPSISLFVECESEAELDDVFTRLEEGGSVLMPPGDYGFSTKFAWISDRFGVSWQLNWTDRDR